MRSFITSAFLRPAVLSLSLTILAASSATAAPPSPPQKSDTAFVEVRADRFFNATNLFARGGESFLVRANARDVVDLSTLNGGYKTFPDGTIATTPPAGSGAFGFFREFGGPVSTDPVAGSRKSSIIYYGQLQGAPYGALVAGFSPTPNPTSLSDFPYGFQLINVKGIARAPGAGGYLFLAVNDINNPGGDNAGAFRARVVRIADGAYDPRLDEREDAGAAPAPAVR